MTLTPEQEEIMRRNGLTWWIGPHTKRIYIHGHYDKTMHYADIKSWDDILEIIVTGRMSK